jgi:low temperature requirement protein LtrA
MSTGLETQSVSDEPPPEPEPRERRTSPIELLWDLVFVFAVTQVTTLMREHLTWGGFGEAMLVLAFVWWAWSAFVWVLNAQQNASRGVSLGLLVAMGSIFVAGLALPQAFTSRAVLFAAAYIVVRLIHLGLYAYESRIGNASRSSIAGFAFTSAVGLVLLMFGAFADGGARIALWTVALAIDFGGPALLARERLRGLQQVAVTHFSERYGLFLIICLGESVIAIGNGARPLSTGRVDAVGLCLAIIVALWWAYFDELAENAERRLREHDDAVIAAVDSYSYIHVLLVAGIIVFAVGARLVVHAGSGSLGDAGRLALCGGIAVYLIGLVAFKWRLLGTRDALKLVAAAVLLAIGWLGGGLDALAVAGLALGILGALTATHLAGWVG